MERKINAILISSNDDVATTIVGYQAGETGCYGVKGQLTEVRIVEDIPQYHKFAVRDIAQGDVVRKYGEVIGLATKCIRQGEHVHDHNIASPISAPQMNSVEVSK